MAVHLRQAELPPLTPITASAPDGALIGLIGEDAGGARSLVRLIGGLEEPTSGEVVASPPRRWLGPEGTLNLAPAGTLALEHSLALRDAVVRARALTGLERLRRAGATIFLLTHEQQLLRSVADEIWWIEGGRLAAKGDPADVLERYNRHVAARLRDWAATIAQPLAPSFRRGDGRAELVRLETLDGEGRPAWVFQSGDEMAVRVAVRFRQEVADPVIGILIRTRIGFEVYGTNTELEKLRLGPCLPGQMLTVTFSFACELCPQEYTITAASHDPDGVWHDWLEDAISFLVTDTRPTAGLANLRARASLEHK